MGQTIHLKRDVKIDTSGGSRPGGMLGARSQTFCFCPSNFWSLMVFWWLWSENNVGGLMGGGGGGGSARALNPPLDT